MAKNTITQETVDAIYNGSKVTIDTIYGKTTVLTVQLENGFVISESSSCVDPSNYDPQVGYEICRDRIKNKIWELEGYKLQDKLYNSTKNVRMN